MPRILFVFINNAAVVTLHTLHKGRLDELVPFQDATISDVVALVEYIIRAAIGRHGRVCQESSNW